MSAEAPVAPVVDEATPKKTAQKKAKAAGKPKTSKALASHPTYGDMIKAALIDLNDKKGSSRAAILKYILQHYKVGDNVTAVNAHLRLALKRGVSGGLLKQTKGVGASGSFRLGEGKAEKPNKVKKLATKKQESEKKSPTKEALKRGRPKKAVAQKSKNEKKSKTSPKKKASPANQKKAKSPKKPKSGKPKATKKASKAKKAAS